MTTYAIFKLETPKNPEDYDGTEVLTYSSEYESNYILDSSDTMSYLVAPPYTIHLEVPEGVDADCTTPSWNSETEVWELSEDSALVTAKVQAGRNTTLGNIRAYRMPLLLEADHEFNKVLDASGSTADWSTYRQALRDITSTYKDGSGDGTSACDAVTDVATDVTWPTKP
jgi:hypothetical protein